MRNQDLKISSAENDKAMLIVEHKVGKGTLPYNILVISTMILMDLEEVEVTANNLADECKERFGKTRVICNECWGTLKTRTDYIDNAKRDVISLFKNALNQF